MPPIAQAPRRYFIEFQGSLLLFLVAVFGRAYAAHWVSAPAFKTMILLSPVLFICLAALAVVRFYRRIDEYHRLQLLEQLAISAGVTAVVTISWIFLEDVGFPHPPIWYAFMVLMGCWGITALYFGWKDKLSEGKGFSALKSVAVTLVVVSVATAVYALIASQSGLPHSWPVLALFATFVFLTRMGYFIFGTKSSSC